MHWLYTKREVTLYICAQFVPCSLRGDKMCLERLHILSFSGDNVCRVRQNVPLKVHILSPATNFAGATKCAVTPAPRSGYATTIIVFFAHLLISEYPDHHQNLISSLLYYPGPHPKISSQSVHNFLSNVVHKQTNRQTNATKKITSFAKEVILGLMYRVRGGLSQISYRYE